MEVNYIVGGTEEEKWQDGTKYESVEEAEGQDINAIEIVQSYDVPDVLRKEFELDDGVKVTVNCMMSTPKSDYKINVNNAYFNIDADVTFSCNVEIDVLEAMGIAPSMQLVKVPIAGVGYIKATLDMSFKGSITLSLVENVSAGIQCDKNGVRLVSKFTKKAFTIEAKVEVSAGIKLSAGFDIAVIEGSIYGTLGGKASVEFCTYNDGKKPNNCMHI